MAHETAPCSQSRQWSHCLKETAQKLGDRVISGRQGVPGDQAIRRSGRQKQRRKLAAVVPSESVARGELSGGTTGLLFFRLVRSTPLFDFLAGAEDVCARDCGGANDCLGGIRLHASELCGLFSPDWRTGQS